MQRIKDAFQMLVAKFKMTEAHSSVAEKMTNLKREPGNAIVLLSCVKLKRGYRCKAGDMYTSALFRKMMAYALSLRPKAIYILSAKYGLIKPDDMIDPYEQTLKNMNTRDRQQWAANVISKLRQGCDLENDSFVVLAGMAYRENLVPHLRHHEVPMAGLSFGRQLQWLDLQLQ